MNKILLVSDNLKELDLLEMNLSRNGFEIVKSSDLKEALKKAAEITPYLIVVDTTALENEVDFFSKQTKIKYVKKTLLPDLINFEDYLTIKTPEHVVLKGLARSNRFRNQKFVFFIS